MAAEAEIRFKCRECLAQAREFSFPTFLEHVAFDHIFKNTNETSHFAFKCNDCDGYFYGTMAAEEHAAHARHTVVANISKITGKSSAPFAWYTKMRDCAMLVGLPQPPPASPAQGPLISPVPPFQDYRSRKRTRSPSESRRNTYTPRSVSSRRPSSRSPIRQMAPYQSSNFYGGGGDYMGRDPPRRQSPPRRNPNDRNDDREKRGNSRDRDRRGPSPRRDRLDSGFTEGFGSPHWDHRDDPPRCGDRRGEYGTERYGREGIEGRQEHFRGEEGRRRDEDRGRRDGYREKRDRRSVSNDRRVESRVRRETDAEQRDRRSVSNDRGHNSRSTRRHVINELEDNNSYRQRNGSPQDSRRNRTEDSQTERSKHSYDNKISNDDKSRHGDDSSARDRVNPDLDVTKLGGNSKRPPPPVPKPETPMAKKAKPSTKKPKKPQTLPFFIPPPEQNTFRPLLLPSEIDDSPEKMDTRPDQGHPSVRSSVRVVEANKTPIRPISTGNSIYVEDCEEDEIVVEKDDNLREPNIQVLSPPTRTAFLPHPNQRDVGPERFPCAMNRPLSHSEMDDIIGNTTSQQPAVEHHGARQKSPARHGHHHRHHQGRQEATEARTPRPSDFNDVYEAPPATPRSEIFASQPSPDRRAVTGHNNHSLAEFCYEDLPKSQEDVTPRSEITASQQRPVGHLGASQKHNSPVRQGHHRQEEARTPSRQSNFNEVYEAQKKTPISELQGSILSDLGFSPPAPLAPSGIAHPKRNADDLSDCFVLSPKRRSSRESLGIPRLARPAFPQKQDSVTSDMKSARERAMSGWENRNIHCGNALPGKSFSRWAGQRASNDIQTIRVMDEAPPRQPTPPPFSLEGINEKKQMERERKAKERELRQKASEQKEAKKCPHSELSPTAEESDQESSERHRSKSPVGTRNRSRDVEHRKSKSKSPVAVSPTKADDTRTRAGDIERHRSKSTSPPVRYNTRTRSGDIERRRYGESPGERQSRKRVRSRQNTSYSRSPACDEGRMAKSPSSR